MSLDDSVELVRRYVEALNTGDLDALDELFADDFVIHQPSGDRRGKAVIRAFVARGAKFRWVWVSSST